MLSINTAQLARRIKPIRYDWYTYSPNFSYVESDGSETSMNPGSTEGYARTELVLQLPFEKEPTQDEINSAINAWCKDHIKP